MQAINKKIERNRKYTLVNGELDFTLNIAGMSFSDKDLDSLKNKFSRVYTEMRKIEAGEIKNPDENRKVTHFTDRAVYVHEEVFSEVEEFADNIRTNEIKGSTGKKIKHVIINGIGGSILGPELLHFALNGPYWNELSGSKRFGNPKIYFVDNTDTSGARDILEIVDLDQSLVLSISKSGGTQETKNNIILFSAAYKEAGLDLNKHACAITMEGSTLDIEAKKHNWLKIFHMSESIGGRTSETSIVGHLPAALAGIDFKSFLKGACEMDIWTRIADYKKNPAYLLASMWYISGKGYGNRNMVVVPYSDRLALFSKYLQQLVMESLGKELDLNGKVVHQGLNVFGNKGGTDAHSYIQQLNDGRNDFFITFIEVLKDSMNVPIEDGVTMGDYLHGFQAGLSSVLESKDREVIQIQISEISAFNLGMLIALYERAVAAYAELININAFHQPGVQAYKLASNETIKMVVEIGKILSKIAPWEGSAQEFCKKTELTLKEIEVSGILAKFAKNNDKRSFKKFSITRKFDISKGWIYYISKK